jgi:hypothetical protein
MFEVTTSYGPARLTAAEPDESGAVLYTATGAVRGPLHVTATHHPSEWHRFSAVRVTLGALHGMDAMPAEPLPRVGRSARPYWATALRKTEEPAHVPWAWQFGEAVDARNGDTARPRAAQALEAVMRACVEDYASRPDLPRLSALARRRETPGLVRWLVVHGIPSREQDAQKYEQEAERHRQHAAQATAAWWTAARWFVAAPSPVLALVLAHAPRSLAHQAAYLLEFADMADEQARSERRILRQFRTEVEELRGAARAERLARRCLSHVRAEEEARSEGVAA